MRIEAFGVSHPGVRRTETEDVIRVDELTGFYLVVDGSRGKQGQWAAEEFSSSLFREISKLSGLRQEYARTGDRSLRLQIAESFGHAVQRSAEHIYRETHTQPEKQGAVISFAGGIWAHDCFIWTHIGNSRIYLLRTGRLHLLSRDHTYFEEMTRSFSPQSKIDPRFRKRLTRAVGDIERVPVDMHICPLIEGDELFLCTNGLSDAVDLEAHFFNASENLGNKERVQGLLNRALADGAPDNISLVHLNLKSNDTATSTDSVLPMFPVHPRAQLDVLRSMEILKMLHEDERSLIMIQNLLTFRQVGPGIPIVREGTESDEIFMIVEGSAEVRSSESPRVVRSDNEIIGEMGFFTREKRSATVVALTPCRLLSIHRTDFDDLVNKDHRIGYAILDGVVRALSHKLKTGPSRCS